MGIAPEPQATYEIGRGSPVGHFFSAYLMYPYVRLSSGAPEPFVAFRFVSRMETRAMPDLDA
jgi:hypothetical protein